MLLRGSEWRRWDVHVHTPDTILANRYGDWEEYIAAVEANNDVKVMGVTDYMSITNYSKLKAFKEAGRIQNIDLLISNIEFRVAPPTDQATAVNIHILVCPDDTNHEQEIINALGRLTWEYDDRTYSCLPDQLRALGKAFDSSIKDEDAALSAGTLQFKVDFTTLRDWYRKEQWLNRNSLIAVSAGSDGLSGFRQDGAWAALRDQITRFSQMLFSGRPKEREFWLCEGSDEEEKEFARSLGAPKPCVHGSDAHEISKLLKPDQDRFCWIKADTTFEGLKQILYEPDDRVYIGPSAPIYYDEARVLTAVGISDSNGWFDDVTIPLNAGLVSIIGQKGTGKSALAEIIAYAAGSWRADETGTFLSRAGDHLDGLKIELIWADGSRSGVELWEGQPEGEAVRYLSQKFVERLCGDDHIGAELIAEIEGVIFSYIDPTDTLNASSFDELRALKTEAIKQAGEQQRADIVRLIREECALRVARGKLSEKKERIKTLTKERDGLAKQMPKAASAEEAKLHSDLQAHRTELAKLQKLVAADKQQLQKIRDIRSRVSTFQAQMNRFATEIDALLKDAGVPASEYAVFHPAFPRETEPPLTKRYAAIEKSVRDREGFGEAAKGTIRWIEQQVAVLTAKESADKARQAKIKEIQTRTSAISTEIERIEGEIAKIEGPDKERLFQASKERLDAYTAYFENRRLEQRALEELYAPVKAQLSAEATAKQEHNLEFSIRWEADLSAWLDRGAPLFDQRRTIPYGTMEGLAEAARKILEPAWTSGDPEKIQASHEKFFGEFRKADLLPKDFLRTNATLEDLLQWLYEVDHIRLSYGLKYNGVELEKLSPGTKGIVLLILYLGIDVDDTRPLIVDQPDENLDNESIFSLLRSYFRTAKRRRQIILITHNPNLVVNGDSEQVIVANAERREDGLPHITYTAGALENTKPGGSGIREQVCRILEGGADAFQRRERRYSLPRS